MYPDKEMGSPYFLRLNKIIEKKSSGRFGDFDVTVDSGLLFLVYILTKER
jgi:hypothetical protein